MTRFVPGPDVPECLSCGTCCFSEMPQYIGVFGVDHERMDARALAFTEFLGDNKCFMRMEGGRCSALAIDPLAKRYACSIYEMRPDCCRALERGSGACLGELGGKSERPLLAVEALLRKTEGRGGGTMSS